MAALLGSEKRKEQRFSVDLPVEITWHGPKGNILTERTRIQDISRSGCRFKLQVELQRGDVVSVLPLGPRGTSVEDEQSKLHEVKWTAPDGTGWTIGALRLEDDDPKTVVVPPPNAHKLPSK
jgi:hypothetical protein